MPAPKPWEIRHRLDTVAQAPSHDLPTQPLQEALALASPTQVISSRRRAGRANKASQSLQNSQTAIKSESASEELLVDTADGPTKASFSSPRTWGKVVIFAVACAGLVWLVWMLWPQGSYRVPPDWKVGRAEHYGRMTGCIDVAALDESIVNLLSSANGSISAAVEAEHQLAIHTYTKILRPMALANPHYYPYMSKTLGTLSANLQENERRISITTGFLEAARLSTSTALAASEDRIKSQQASRLAYYAKAKSPRESTAVVADARAELRRYDEEITTCQGHSTSIGKLDTSLGEAIKIWEMHRFRIGEIRNTVLEWQVSGDLMTREQYGETLDRFCLTTTQALGASDLPLC